jgi:hypothetical protein
VGNIMDRVEEALNRFKLVKETAGSEEKGTACPVSALSWIAGTEWSDHPSCAHPMICDITINAADDIETTPNDLEALVRAGVTGLIDTADIPTEVVLAAISGARLLHLLAGKAHMSPTGFFVPPVTQALCVLEAISAWKDGVRGETGPLFLAGVKFCAFADLADLDLSGADLRRVNLDSANMSGVNLQGANLRDASLIRANLLDADLRGADFTDTDLRGANLTHANLDGAIFVYARLDFANLTGPWVDGADFMNAGMYMARWTHSTTPPGWEIRRGHLVSRSVMHHPQE